MRCERLVTVIPPTSVLCVGIYADRVKDIRVKMWDLSCIWSPAISYPLGSWSRWHQLFVFLVFFFKFIKKTGQLLGSFSKLTSNKWDNTHSHTTQHSPRTLTMLCLFVTLKALVSRESAVTIRRCLKLAFDKMEWHFFELFTWQFFFCNFDGGFWSVA